MSLDLAYRTFLGASMPHVTPSDNPILSTLPRALIIQDTLDVRVYEGDREQVHYERSDHTAEGG